MFKIPRPHSWPPALDLTTVRDTLDYMREDVARVPGLERVAAALEDALIEIEVAEREQSARLTLPAANKAGTARFLPWNPRGTEKSRRLSD